MWIVESIFCASCRCLSEVMQKTTKKAIKALNSLSLNSIWCFTFFFFFCLIERADDHLLLMFFLQLLVLFARRLLHSQKEKQPSGLNGRRVIFFIFLCSFVHCFIVSVGCGCLFLAKKNAYFVEYTKAPEWTHVVRIISVNDKYFLDILIAIINTT